MHMMVLHSLHLNRVNEWFMSSFSTNITNLLRFFPFYFSWTAKYSQFFEKLLKYLHSKKCKCMNEFETEMKFCAKNVWKNYKQNIWLAENHSFIKRPHQT